MNFNNIENYAELLNDTQTTEVELYGELTEGELDELFCDLDAEIQSNDWEDRGGEPEYNPLESRIYDLTDAEFDMLMDVH
jgi:hypothetical protein